MTLNVVALDRGGYSAHGGGWWDARERIVRLDVFEDEVIDVVIQFKEAPTELNYEEDGIDGATPVISGTTVTVQFQELNPNGVYEMLVFFGSGAKKRVRFQANPAQPIATGSITTTDDDDVDYGAWG